MSMRKKYSGSVIRANPVVPTEDSAPGIWTLEQQNQNQKKGTWPFIGDPNFKDTILLLHGDTNQQPSIEDKSASNHQVTVVGDAKATNWNPFNVPEGYWSRSIDSSGDTSDYHSTITLGTDDFTIGMWVFPTGYDGTIQSLADHVTLYASAGNELILAHSQFLSHYNGADWNIEINYTTDLVINTWQWIQVDKTGNLYRVSIDGSYVDGGGQSSSDSFGAFGNTYFGHRSGQKDYLGYMSNFVFIIGTNRGTIAPPTAPIVANANTDIITYQSNRFVNKGNTSLTFTVNASTKNKTSTFSPFSYTPTTTVNNYGSYYFDGTGDRLTVVGGENIGTVDFTISAWVYRTSSGTYPVILDTRSSDSDTKPVIYTDGGNLYYYTAGGIRITGSGVINNNEWIFIRLVKESSVTKLFVNGTQVGSDYADTNNYAPTNDWEIGSRHTNQHYWYGYISDLQVVLRALDGTSVPIKPVELTLTEGENSVKFDGTDDYLTVPNSTNTNIGGYSEDYTVSCWFNLDTITSAHRVLFGMSNGSGGVNKWLVGINMSSTAAYSANKVGIYSYANASARGDGTYSPGFLANNWYYFTLVYTHSNTTLKAYINGTEVVSVSSNVDSSTGAFTIGTDGEQNGDFIGHISNFRLVKGQALETTVPEEPFSGTTGVLLACASRYIEDRSPQKLNVAAYGNSVVSGFNPFNEGYWSNDFDGTSDSLTITSTAALQLPDEFTIEFFMRLDTVVVDTQHPSPITFPSNGSYITQVYVQASDGYVGLYYNGDIVRSADGSIVANKWYHVAVGRDSSDQIALWLDGVRVATDTNGFSVGNSSGTFRIGSYSGTGGDVNGKISNLRIVKGSDVYGYSNTTITVPTSPLTKISGTSLLTCQSNRFLDNSASSHSITVSGDTSISNDIPFTLLSRQTKLLNLQNNQDVNNNSFQDSSILRTLITRDGTTTTQGTFSPFSAEEGYWSNKFDGSDDYLSIADSTDFTFGSGDFTIECWVYWESVSGDRYVYGQSHGAPASQTSFQLYSSGTTLYAWTGLGSATATITANRWYHVAFVRQSNTLRLYLQGVQEGTQTISGSITDSSGIFAIGRVGAYNAAYFQGFVSNLNIIKGTAKYPDGTTFSVPTGKTIAHANTVLLTCQSSRFIDNSSSGHALTVNSNPKVLPYAPFAPRRSYSKEVVGGSAYFDGSSHIQGTLSSPIGTGDMTVEFWFYPTSFYDYITMFAISAGSTRNAGFNIGTETSNSGQLKFVDTGKGSNLTVNNQLQLNAWKHIACTRSGTTVRLFVDGTEVGSYTDSQNWTGTDFAVGGRSDDGTEECTGYIANLNLVIGTAKYTSDFDQPTSPITTHANTRLLMNFTDGAVIDNTGKNNLETIADAKVSSYVRKFGNGSMYFDGTGDYLVVSDSNLSTSFFSPATDDFTWEMFVRFSVLSGGSLYTLFSKYGNAAEYQFFYNAGNHWNLSHGASTVQWADTSIVVNTWYHIALVKDGTDFEVFRNGTSLGTVTHSNPSAGARPFVLGATFDGSNNATYNLNGYLDDVRITKGVARYISNFTAPTRAFKNR